MTSPWRKALPWPLAVIDFEASSLDQDSYPIEVGLAFAEGLNAMLGPGRIAWCDGDAYDIHWTGKLFEAAKMTPLFHLGAWHRLIVLLDPAMRKRGLDWLDQAPARHRARDDAEQLLRVLAYAVAMETITVEEYGP